MIAANEQKIHNRIASGKFDGPDRHDRDDPEDNYGHLMLQVINTTDFAALMLYTLFGFKSFLLSITSYGLMP